ncbi:ATP-binding protein [Campylobacter sp. CX2-4080-23]|uniref:ATP-binding protein n=1 Tax=Campylobacter porcelli TaxID=1660073 RepID=UPI002EB5D71D|nr:ATP-binding protein [Campylobacter sp. CX2-4080-23]
MQKRVFYFIIFSMLGLAIFINLFLIFSIESVLKDELFSRLKSYASGIKDEVISSIQNSYYVNLKYQDYRISLIDENGSVIYDNLSENLPIHSDRIEIKNAMKNGESKSIRYSNTLLKRHLYYAVKIPTNKGEFILRIAKEQEYLYAIFMSFIPYILGEIIAVLIFSFLLAKYLTHIILRPIYNIDLKNLDEDLPYPELKILIETLKKQNKIIKSQFKNLKQKRQELQSLTKGMKDGLIIINRSGEILSINPSAQKYFVNLAKHTSISEIQNDLFLKLLLHNLRDFKDGKITSEIREQIVFMQETLVECEVVLSPIFSQKGKFKGLIIVICDITEFKRNQNLSKEFSANVTHELKTPLTSIMGNAEMIKNNLVKSDDLPHFIDTIYDESKRLLGLIEDILKLSFLDESSTKNIPFAKIELKNMVLKIYSNLKNIAKKYDIEFEFELEEGYIHGSKELLEYAIYNLCDNAIKYNNPGGYVKIKIRNLQDCVELSIKDSGIGIDKADQDHIFERFYCADKSYSKKVGGTGLGLSIVKSILAIHHAKLKLNSQKDIGSEFIITFDKI